MWSLASSHGIAIGAGEGVSVAGGLGAGSTVTVGVLDVCGSPCFTAGVSESLLQLTSRVRTADRKTVYSIYLKCFFIVL